MASSQQRQGEVLLSVRNLCRSVDKQQLLWRGITFDICKGDILFVRGPSGVGKTLLLRTLSSLDPIEGGQLLLHGNQSPSDVGIPCWRAQVMYVHQQRVSYPGTPLQLFERVQQFASQKSRRSQHGPGQHGPGSEADLGQLVEHMGLDQSVLSQPWSQLSGGQAQRVTLAVSIALRPQVLLLDEPTSACDMDATLRVEAVLQQAAATAAVVWVTHDEQQPTRVGGKVLSLPAGDMSYTDGSIQQQQRQQQVISSSQQQQDQHTVWIPDPCAASPPQGAWRDEGSTAKA